MTQPSCLWFHLQANSLATGTDAIAVLPPRPAVLLFVPTRWPATHPSTAHGTCQTLAGARSPRLPVDNRQQQREQRWWVVLAIMSRHHRLHAVAASLPEILVPDTLKTKRQLQACN
jgi:hypothetical protein